MFTAVSPFTAPQTTGHPAALPQDPGHRPTDTRVPAVRAGADATAAGSDTAGAQARPWSQSRNRAAAPPTILQIKINTLLAEQQQRRAEQQRNSSGAAFAVPQPPSPLDGAAQQASLTPWTPAHADAPNREPPDGADGVQTGATGPAPDRRPSHPAAATDAPPRDTPARRQTGAPYAAAWQPRLPEPALSRAI